MEEEEILALFEQDVEAGAAALVEHYQYLLWGICARRLSDPEDIWECVYAALGDFCVNWKKFDPRRGALKSYLVSIADRKALDQYRQNQRWERTRRAAERRDEPAQPPAAFGEMLSGMERLTPKERQLLHLRYVRGIPYSDIARLLGLPYEQVKKQGYRAFLKLKRLWKP